MEQEKFVDSNNNHKEEIKGGDQKSEDQLPDQNKKVFMCPYIYCGRRFTESGNLKTHIRIHVLSSQTKY